mmetsp:Transcript_40683/g.46885  ORF Transcript_40683/g.46885 Transcript_40683/m.46885 type:complete len:85 (+) Transcript_40683:116-370(+)
MVATATANFVRAFFVVPMVALIARPVRGQEIFLLGQQRMTNKMDSNGVCVLNIYFFLNEQTNKSQTRPNSRLTSKQHELYISNQ